MSSGILNVTAGTGVTGNGTASVTITGTAAQINAALAGLTYTGNLNFNGGDTLTVATNDGTATDTDLIAITVTPVNDAPVNTVPAAQSVDEDTILPIAGVSVADIDSSALTTTLNVSSGTLTVTAGAGVTGNGTASVTIAGTAAQINAALAGLAYTGNLNFNGGDTLTVATSDGTATDTDLIAIIVNPVNDAPVNTVPGAQSVAEDTILPIAGVSVADIDSSTLTTTLNVSSGILNVTAGAGAVVTGNASASVIITGTAAEINAALTGLAYTGNPNFNGADTLTVATSDGTATDTDLIAITVNPVNEAPVNTVPGAQSVAEDTALPIAGVSVADVDGDALTTTLNVSSGILNVTAGAGVTGNGSASVSIAGTAAQINAALAGLTYTGSLDFNGADTLTVATSDGTAIGTDTIAITVNPVNDAPVLVVADAIYQEDVPVLLSPSASLTDVDDTEFDFAAVQITAGSFTGDGDTLTVNGATSGTLTGITFLWDPTLHALVLTGASSVANYQALLQTVTFQSTNHNPTDFDTSPQRTLTWFVSDGTAVTSATTTLDIVTHDDPAVAQPDAVPTTENAVILGRAVAGNLFVNNGFGVDSDPDGGAFVVTAVSVGTVGTPIALPSGALLIVNANGTFNYDPNHTFDYLPAPGSGASNLTINDTFSYAITGGDTATVTVTVSGVDSNDVLYDSTGIDSLAGGILNDVYYVHNTGDVVTEAANAGSDTVAAFVNYTLPSSNTVEVLNMIGSGPVLTGTGTDGPETFISSSGPHTLIGLGGNDVYYVNSTGDVVTEDVSGGIDTVQATVSYTMPANAEGLYMLGSGLTGTGTEGADSLLSSGGPNTLVGLGGDDLYYVNNAADMVVEAANGGFDSVMTSLSYTLPDNVEALYVTGTGLTGSGNSGANTLVTTGANTLVGDDGNDTFVFSAGSANGATVADFNRDQVSEWDFLVFSGFGTEAQGATFTQIGTTDQWEVHSGLDPNLETVITFSNHAALHAGDFVFV